MCEALEKLMQECNESTPHEFSEEVSRIGKPILSKNGATFHCAEEPAQPEPAFTSTKDEANRLTKELIGDRFYSTRPDAGILRGRSSREAYWGPKLLNARHRMITALAARGLTSKEIHEHLISRGIKVAPMTVATLMSSPLGKLEIERHLQKTEQVLDEELRVSTEMVKSALSVIHDANRGFVRRAVPMPDGTIQETVVPIKPDLQLKSAFDTANRYAGTAPVTRSREEAPLGGLLSKDILAKLQARYDMARATIPVQAEAV